MSLGAAISRLKKAANTWGLRVRVRQQDLTLVLDELSRLRVQALKTTLDAATREPEPGAEVIAPGEFAAMWNLRDEKGRQAILDRINDSMEAALQCTMQDHEALKAQLEIARHVSSADLNRLAQYAYEEITKNGQQLRMEMTEKSALADALERALARIGIRKMSKPENWTVEYGHPDCAECEDCAEQAISYAKAANSLTKHLVSSAFDGHFGTAERSL